MDPVHAEILPATPNPSGPHRSRERPERCRFCEEIMTAQEIAMLRILRQDGSYYLTSEGMRVVGNLRGNHDETWTG
jgi:hypothetical protein